MTILALEFSSEQRSVAVLRGAHAPSRAACGASSNAPVFVSEGADECSRGGAPQIFEAVETGGRNTAAFGMIEKVLAEAESGRDEIEAIAVGLGPGSYTGIRAAISVAQGWQLAFAEPEHDICRHTMATAQRRLAREIKLLGISSVEAIAAQAQAEKIFGRVNVVVDAQRGEFYLAAFEISADDVKETGALKISSLAEVQLRAGAGKILAGPEITRWFPAGRTIFPRAAMLAKLAANRGDFVAGEKLEPVYLRETNFVKAARPKTVV